MPSTVVSDIQREMIADILAVCRRCGWRTDVRPKFEAYFHQGGRFFDQPIKAVGGWKAICAQAGMHSLSELRARAAEQKRRHPEADVDAIVADVRRVAQELRLKPGARLTYARYRRCGGFWAERTIHEMGGWTQLSTEAGFGSASGGNTPRHRQWQKTRSSVTIRQFEEALDRARGHVRVPQGILRMMGVKRCRGPRPKPLHPQVLERGEVIADLREIALSLGLHSPGLLTWDTYRSRGGRYTYEQVSALGGFNSLRKAA